MGPRTAYRNGSLMLFSNGDPGRQDSVALSEDGVVLRLGEERSLLRWAELARMDVQPSGVRRARSGRVQRWIEQATLLLLRLAAALLFALTFGGLGGSGIWGAGSIRITPVLRGKPEAFSLTYSIPIRWPPDTTALEVEWFEPLRLQPREGMCALTSTDCRNCWTTPSASRSSAAGSGKQCSGDVGTREASRHRRPVHHCDGVAGHQRRPDRHAHYGYSYGPADAACAGCPGRSPPRG